MQDFYRFPRAKFADTNDINKQVLHTISESREVLAEFNSLTIRYDEIAIELLDLIHSSETALRILAERHNVNVELAKEYVEMKNAARGYYNKREG